jgi:hypothetical protein
MYSTCSLCSHLFRVAMHWMVSLNARWIHALCRTHTMHVDSIINTLNLVSRSQRIGSWIPSGRLRKEGIFSSATNGGTLASGGQPHLQTLSGRCGSSTISPSREQ